MTKLTFTPGPWGLSGAFGIYAKNFKPVANIVVDNCVPNYAQNGQLIAAAPDMYAEIEATKHMAQELLHLMQETSDADEVTQCDRISLEPDELEIIRNQLTATFRSCEEILKKVRGER